MAKQLTFYGERCYPPQRGAVGFDSISLKRGLNTLSDDEANRLIQHPDYPRYEHWRAIEWITNKPVIDVTNPPANLSAYSEDAIELLLNSVHDVSVLEKWKIAETRRGVQNKIATRITALQSGSLPVVTPQESPAPVPAPEPVQQQTSLPENLLAINVVDVDKYLEQADVATLEKWKAQESRSTVLTKIDAKIAKSAK